MARSHGFLMDMHVHSKFSGESDADPLELIDAALQKGLDGICITEHDSLYASAPFEMYRKTTRLVIIRGVEIDTNAGHMLVFGVDESDWDDYGKSHGVDAQDLIDKVNGMGGVVIPAHPYSLEWTKPLDPNPTVMVEERLRGLCGLAALEVCNGKQHRYPTICRVLSEYARELGLKGTGGSDAHIPENIGRSYTVFRRPIQTSKDLAEAIRSGQFHPQSA